MFSLGYASQSKEKEERTIKSKTTIKVVEEC